MRNGWLWFGLWVLLMLMEALGASRAQDRIVYSNMVVCTELTGCHYF